MSELINTRNNCRNFREQLLMTASAAALFLVTIEPGAADPYLTSSDHPPFWIELGGEADQMSGSLDPFVASFTQLPGSFTGGSFAPIIQKGPIWAYGGEGKVSYEPYGTDWIFSASVRYGRALRHALQHVQTSGVKYPPKGAYYDAGATTTKSHLIVDFQAGKDVGLGFLGQHAHSAFSAGLRIAQFTAHSSGFVSSAPTQNDIYSYKEKIHMDRDSMAIGPSIAWDASVPVIGQPQRGLSLDWGANAAVLFGRQKAKFSLQSFQTILVSRGYPGFYTHHTLPGARAKTVTIPNVGGFVGLSFRRPAAKVSLGYRADMYFGAIDAGFSTRRSASQSFYGPFLTVGIGIGG